MVSKISVIGLGYIGLPTAAIFATHGVPVIGVDVNQAAVDTINRGEIHIIEPDLDIAVQKAVADGLLRATLTAEPADAFLVAVPTPFQGEDHTPDLSYIKSAATQIAKVLKPGNLVILESTSPVGATEKMAAWLAAACPDLTFPQTHGDASDIRVAHCPERVLPGKVMQELISNDRVIGGMTSRCSSQAQALYKIFVKGDCVITNAPTAEMAKLTENSFRDVNIAFANELSVICDKLDIDVWELISLANRHPRVNILQPGPGVGGHCIAVDPWFIVSSAPEQSRLIHTARIVNDAKPGWVLDKISGQIADHIAENPTLQDKDITVACYGIAFKPDIDDLRESPSMGIVQALLERHNCAVQIVEPNIDHVPDSLNAAQLVTQAEAYETADLHVLLVPHSPFRSVTVPKGRKVDATGLWQS